MALLTRSSFLQNIQTTLGVLLVGGISCLHCLYTFRWQVEEGIFLVAFIMAFIVLFLCHRERTKQIEAMQLTIKLLQKELLQEKLLQEKLLQEKLLQEKLLQEKLLQEKLLQEQLPPLPQASTNLVHDAKYLQLREQFEEKAKILDATRKELFFTSEERDLLKKMLFELQAQPVSEQERYLMKLIEQSQVELEQSKQEISTYETLLDELITTASMK